MIDRAEFPVTLEALQAAGRRVRLKQAVAARVRAPRSGWIPPPPAGGWLDALITRHAQEHSEGEAVAAARELAALRLAAVTPTHPRRGGSAR